MTMNIKSGRNEQAEESFPILIHFQRAHSASSKEKVPLITIIIHGGDLQELSFIIPPSESSDGQNNQIRVDSLQTQQMNLSENAFLGNQCDKTQRCKMFNECSGRQGDGVP
jgi:hypothetical protein